LIQEAGLGEGRVYDLEKDVRRKSMKIWSRTNAMMKGRRTSDGRQIRWRGSLHILFVEDHCEGFKLRVGFKDGSKVYF
jgi:hypothetical protein